MATNAVDRNTNSSAVFKLTFAAGSELHGATSTFLASNITGFPSANNATLAQIMASYWISFATTYDPNPARVASAPFWPSYVSNGAGSAAVGESVGFDTLAVTYTTIAPAADPDVGAKCDFFYAHQYQVWRSCRLDGSDLLTSLLGAELVDRVRWSRTECRRRPLRVTSSYANFGRQRRPSRQCTRSLCVHNWTTVGVR